MYVAIAYRPLCHVVMIMGVHNDLAASGKIKPGKVGCEASEGARNGEGGDFPPRYKTDITSVLGTDGSDYFPWSAVFNLRDACMLGISMCSFTRTLTIIPILYIVLKT